MIKIIHDTKNAVINSNTKIFSFEKEFINFVFYQIHIFLIKILNLDFLQKSQNIIPITATKRMRKINFEKLFSLV